MLFYILKGKGEGGSLSIITQEWGKRWRELKGNKEKEDEKRKKWWLQPKSEEKKKSQLPEELKIWLFST